MKSAEVRVESLCKSYGDLKAVDDVSLTIEPGSMVALLGPSGCGKTTCLRMVAGLIRPSSGAIRINGNDVTPVPVHRRNIGMLFQNYALFPHMTVEENIAFGLQMRGTSKADIVRKVADALALVQLSALGKRYPAQLSGGQQQRVALGRALVIEPAVLLLDEPLGALDKGLRESMQVELRALQQRLKLTTVMVTHDQDEALTMADKIVVMRGGRLEQVGSATEIYQRPASTFVARFIGASNLFEGRVAARRGNEAEIVAQSGMRFRVDRFSHDSENVTISVRPESILVDKVAAGAAPEEANAVRARIDQVVYRGFISHYYMTTADGGELIAFEQNQSSGTGLHYRAGDEVLARWSPSAVHVIPQA